MTSITIPERLGTMTLPGTTLFPGSLLPLYIFEPRYRAMLAKALEEERIFAVTNMNEITGRPATVGGAGLIRACVQNEDGTSHLVLQGIGRIKFTRWEQEQPYFLGAAQQLSTPPIERQIALPLMREIRSLCVRLASGVGGLPEKFTFYLDAIDDPDVFSDVLAATLIADAETRQSLLEELDTLVRLEIVRKSLQSIAETNTTG